jgi:dolichol-phosphate mannosyltransferase
MKVQQSHLFLTPPTGDLQVPLSPPPPDDGNLEAEKNYPLSLSLVIPTYNERQNIVQLVNILSQILDEALAKDYELIVVDDNSPDRTWEVAASLIAEYPQLRVLRREGEKGLSSAVVAMWKGVESANGV